jgi:hypothetical protein
MVLQMPLFLIKMWAGSLTSLAQESATRLTKGTPYTFLSSSLRKGSVQSLVTEPDNHSQRASSPGDYEVQIPNKDCRHDESETREIKALVLRRKGLDVYERVGIVGGGHWKDRESRDWMQEQTITII